MKRTLKALGHGTSVIRIGEFLYMAPYSSGRTRTELMPKLFSKGLGRDQGMVNLSDQFVPHRKNDTHPLSETIREMPLAGYSYAVIGGGMLSEAARLFNHDRTGDIRQLSFLLCPVFGTDRFSLYPHKRRPHMYDSTGALNLMIHRNEVELTKLAPMLGFGSGRRGFISLRNTLLFTELNHDILSCAGGDGVKRIDMDAMDEDKHFARIFSHPAFPFFCDEYCINVDRVLDTINEVGLCGQMHDYADKLSYLTRDVFELLRISCGYELGGSVEGLPTDNRIASIVMEDPEVCALWKSADVIDGKLVITNHRKLARFLRLRAAMYSDGYHSPETIAGETVLGRAVVGSMYMRGEVSAGGLMSMTDTELENKMAAYLGSPGFLEKFSAARTLHEEFDSREEALARSRHFTEKRDSIVVLERFEHKTSTGAKLITRKDGKIGSFGDLYPEDTELVKSTFAIQKPYWLCVRDFDSLGVPKERHMSLRRDLSIVPAVIE